MAKRCITAKNAPPAMGPYSHGVAAGNLLFLSGQVPLAADGSGPQHGTIDEEARLVLSNVKAILEESGSSMDQVVKVTAYLSDMNDFGSFNTVYAEFFPDNCPARTCIQAGRLPLDFKVEVEVIALLPE